MEFLWNLIMDNASVAITALIGIGGGLFVKIFKVLKSVSTLLNELTTALADKKVDRDEFKRISDAASSLLAVFRGKI